MGLRRDGSDPNASAVCPSWTARPLQRDLAEGHSTSEPEGPRAHLQLSLLGQSKATQGQFLAWPEPSHPSCSVAPWSGAT